jgi:hypothetical protein
MILTQFWLPKGFSTLSWALGSSSQTSSTQKRYSYLPGVRVKLTSQVPLLSFFIGRLLTSQFLKSPAKKTLSASGAYKLNRTFLVLGLASSNGFFFIFFLLISVFVICFRISFCLCYLGMKMVWNYGSTRGNMIQKVV